MKEQIINKIDSLIAEAKKDSYYSSETRTEVICALAEVKSFVKTL